MILFFFCIDSCNFHHSVIRIRAWQTKHYLFLEFSWCNIADHQYHTAIVKASHNSYLIEMYDIIQLRILRYRYYARYRVGEKVLFSMIKNDHRSHHAIYCSMKIGYSTLAKNEIEIHIDGMKPFVTNLNEFTK
ncbi:FCD domain-containing protein [Clostridium sp. JS66]|uniref:FCD domain-containing protein n=1 Tax=Clostridium sp. JS66 TaxID=3064705 RepID=UPI00399C3548